MAATAGIKIGAKCVAYRNTAGSTPYASPTWTGIDHVRDSTNAFPWDMADASVRASRVKLYHPTQQDFAVSLTVRCDDANAGYQALLAASQEGTTLDLLLMDGSNLTEGAAGVRAHFHASLTGQPQGIGDVLYATFDLKPGFGVNDSGAPVYPKYVVAGAPTGTPATVPTLTYSDPG